MVSKFDEEGLGQAKKLAVINARSIGILLIQIQLEARDNLL
jgi:hypothetical protein